MGVADVQPLLEPLARHAWDRPASVAISGADGDISYSELVTTVCSWASEIRRQGARHTVAVLVDRTSASYLAYLAAMAADCAVVPIDKGTPGLRARAILQSSKAESVIIPPGVAAPWADSYVSRILLSESVLGDSSHVGASCTQLSSVRGRASALAYVVYTSGSTGVPKGVPISLGELDAFLSDARTRYDIAPGDRHSALFSLTFDLALYDAFMTLGAGATLVLPTPADYLRPHAYVRRESLTHWYSVPSLIIAATRSGELGDAMPTLRSSMFCGEPLTYHYADIWRRAATRSSIHNVYGPTETTLTCAQYMLPRDPDAWPETPNGTVPIGVVYPSFDWRLFGPRHELQLRGPQRFAGYTDRAASTRAFVDDKGRAAGSVAEIPQDLWYRTGDHMSMADGQLVHMGRLDRQVKIRGHRVELGEIETVARTARGVAEAVAITIDKIGATVVGLAYTGTAEPARVREQLRRSLPTHMLPSAVHRLDKIPLNANGKVSWAEVATLLGSPLSARADQH